MDYKQYLIKMVGENNKYSTGGRNPNWVAKSNACKYWTKAGAKTQITILARQKSIECQVVTIYVKDESDSNWDDGDGNWEEF
jgi:hypothetical protein